MFQFPNFCTQCTSIADFTTTTSAHTSCLPSVSFSHFQFHHKIFNIFDSNSVSGSITKNNVLLIWSTTPAASLAKDEHRDPRDTNNLMLPGHQMSDVSLQYLDLLAKVAGGSNGHSESAQYVANTNRKLRGAARIYNEPWQAVTLARLRLAIHTSWFISSKASEHVSPFPRFQFATHSSMENPDSEFFE